MNKRMILYLVIFGMLFSLGITVGMFAPSRGISLPVTALAKTDKTSASLGQSSLGKVEISFPFVKQKGYASNQFAVWIEDAEGNFLKTLYVTNFTARKGYKTREDSLKTWVKRSKRAEAAKEEIDAVSGATPRTGKLTYTWNCDDRQGNPVSPGNYRFFVEGTLFWKSNVIYSGTITVGGKGGASILVKAEYSSSDEKNKNMIGPVTAVYIH
ncbi:MAG: DUF2271 domain-containing protein [Firmicutes bacterium]|nr:DUF2271 domain-containing protein [Bacillota bacterium]